MQEKIVKVDKTIYIAIDGKEFDNKWGCDNYEYELDLIKKEKEASCLECKMDIDYPSIASPQSKCMYKWFKIKNRKDLELFCKSYEDYNLKLRDIDSVEKSLIYPDYICFIDYPQGPESPDWFILSNILSQLNTFMRQFNFDEEGNLL